VTNALADLEKGWTLKGRALPWNWSEGFLRLLLRAVYRIVPSPGPMKPEVKAMALDEVRKGTWTGRRPDWVDPGRVADAWWLGADDYGRTICAPCALVRGEIVATGAVLRKHRRGLT
jgi:hypothetical protein